MFCKNCGKEMDDGANYCPNCGTAQGSRTETSTLERINSFPPHDKPDPLYSATAGRKEPPLRGSLSIFPLFGILGLMLMVASLMVTYYTYDTVSSLEKNLSQYYNQIDDDSLVGRIGGSIMDFFTGGTLTQKREDVKKMEQDLKDGRALLSGGLLCAFLSVFFSLWGVLRNIKAPLDGRVLFLFAFLLSLAAPVIIFISSMLLYMVNSLLIINVTASLIAFILFMVESQRIKALRSAYMHSGPRKRPIPAKP